MRFFFDEFRVPAVAALPLSKFCWIYTLVYHTPPLQRTCLKQ